MKRDNLEELSVDGKIILKWIFKKLDGEARKGEWYVAGCCECGNELSGSV